MITLKRIIDSRNILVTKLKATMYFEGFRCVGQCMYVVMAMLKTVFVYDTRKVCTFESISDNHKCDKIPNTTFYMSWKLFCKTAQPFIVVHVAFPFTKPTDVQTSFHNCSVKKVGQNVYVLLSLFIYLIFHPISHSLWFPCIFFQLV